MQRVYVEQGDLMGKGDLIAEVDPVDFEIQVCEIERPWRKPSPGMY